MRRSFLGYLPAAFWAAVIALVAGASQLPPVPTLPYVDKVGHFGIYFLLGSLLGWGWLRAGRRPHWGWLLLFAALLGISDELRHAHMPERTAEVGDWIADVAGASTGLFLSVRLLRGRYRRLTVERDHD